MEAPTRDCTRLVYFVRDLRRFWVAVDVDNGVN